MSRKRTISKVSGSVALVLSMIAFVLGIAPLTPAIFLTVITLPLAVLSYILGTRRLALLTTYWIAASFLTVPVSQALQFQIDYLLVFLGIGGLALTAILYFKYRGTKLVA